MNKTIIYTKDAPNPVGPYSQANAGCNLLFISGQVAIDPSTNKLKTENIEVETTQVLKNIGAILTAAGLEYIDVLKCSVFVSDMNLYSRINTVYAQFFDEDTAPARELVEVSGLPLDANIEISAIAITR